MQKIDKKITGYSVVAKDAIAEMKSVVAPETKITIMSSDWKRNHTLPASVYKIEKCPNSPDAAVYVTISNAVLNEGTEHQMIVPAEIFINSKDVSHQQWIVALTRTISAIFRKGGDVSFLVEELLGICDPGAGFLQRGVWHPSLVSQVGGVIKEHLEELKRNERNKIDECESETYPPGMREPHQPLWGRGGLYEERKQWLNPEESSPYPPNSTLCLQCNHRAVVVLDGCKTCLGCGESKCG